MNRVGLRLAKMGLASLVTLVALCACSGGGGSSGGDPANAVVMSITGENPAMMIYSGTDTFPPNCITGIPSNGAIRFSFGGAVDLASLPPAGSMTGTISISVNGAGTPVGAQGALTVEDDPNFPPGNRRQVVFTPRAPSTLAAADGGMAPNTTYNLFLPAAPNPAVMIDGVPLQVAVLACFTTCPLQGAGACVGDGVAGNPFIVSTIPPTAEVAGTPVPLSTLPSGLIQIVVSEGIDAADFNAGSIRLVNVATSAPVPGTAAYFPPGSSGNQVQSLITFQPSAGLAPNSTYRIELPATLRDFAGNALRLYDQPNAALERRFATQDVPFIAGTPLVEDFTTTNNRATANGSVQWEGTGSVGVITPEELFGDGSFGPLFFAIGPNVLDTGMPDIPNGMGGFAFERGIWNSSVILASPGAQVQITGDYPVQWRATGTVTIQGSVDASAPTDPVRAAGAGLFNQGGSPANSIVRGGQGGPGAGDGGRASQAGFMLRTKQAESGFGMRMNGMPQPGLGGQGGAGAFRFPAGGISGDLGGQGGAGGAAFTEGEASRARTGMAFGCTEAGFQGNAPPTSPTPVPAEFMAPVSEIAAGSGGGGGGDRFETTGVPQDDQGGGGGGGGGGLGIISMGNILLGPNASLLARGGGGGAGNAFFGGGGGGGGGGMIWLRAVDSILSSTTTVLDADGGARGTECTDHHSGAGGIGLIQLEDRDGIISGGFTGGTQGNVVTLAAGVSTAVTGLATTTFFDTQSIATDYTSVDVVSSLGNIPGAAIVIEAQGAREAISGGAPDLAQLSARTPITMIDSLDGYRYIRLFLSLSYPLPSSTTGLPQGSVLPSISSFTVNYNIPDPLPPLSN